MKVKKHILNIAETICLFMIVLVCLGGCGKSSDARRDSSIDFSNPLNEGEQAYEFVEKETYINYLTIEQDMGELQPTDNSLAIGDPFVLRYNGMYYMYPSSSGGTEKERGIRVFVSEDMVNWTYRGFAAEGYAATYGWAPEVVYYNGTFYMVTGPNGTSHYVLASDNPLGPFTPVSEDLGSGIDGSLWIGDDGTMYFLYAPEANGGLQGVAVFDPETGTLGRAADLLTYLGGRFAEAPTLFERNGIMFLTYNGQTTKSEGYRGGYSYNLTRNPMDVFTVPENNILTLNASGKGYYAAGLTGNVIGPNLDSWYAVYHIVTNFSNPFWREMCIDQVVTNGAQAMMNGLTYTPVAMPERPDFEVRDVKEGFLSEKGTEEIYTIEYNVTPHDRNELEFLFAYDNEKNYTSVRWNQTQGVLKLVNVENGRETELAGSDVPGLLTDVLHTIRIEKGADEIIVYMDTMKKLEASADGITAGKIGVKGNAEYSYLAFSNDAFGSSDFETIKNVPASFAAVHYLKGENRGWSIKNAKVKEGGVRQNERENTNRNEDDLSNSLILDTSGDWVKYALCAAEESYYGLSGRVTASSAGTQIQVIIDATDIYTITVPETGTDEASFINVMLSQFWLSEGNHTLKIRLVSGCLEVQTFELEQTNPIKVDYEDALNEIRHDLYSYDGDWAIADEAHVAAGESSRYPAYMCIGGTLTDCNIEVEVAVKDLLSGAFGGIRFRADEICPTRTGENDYAFQGYYLTISGTQLQLMRCNYDELILDTVRVDFNQDEYHKFRISAVNNHIQIYLDDNKEAIMDVYDHNAFLSGQVVLIAQGMEIGFKNLKITN